MTARTLSITFISTALLAMATHTVQADTAVAGKVGTLGLGVEAIKPLEKVDLRFGVNKLDYDHNDTLDGTNYNVDLGLQTVTALVDWHPKQNGFFVSGGAMINDNKLTASATAVGTEDIGGANPNAGVTISSGISFDDVSPYLGIGYRKSGHKGWGFTAEAGVLYQGTPDVSLTTSDANFNTNQADNIAQEEANIRNDLDALKYMPVVSIGAVYNF
ncbi:MAG: hypothetical protein KJ914_11980 [Gammaproteobacteria bacterium]|nr:hypothetical protein [Gammaproteobacteria bacterium]MBU1725967.1 hypothetical protein [Gammaproteobacteria bacterium]MBU2006071.1 hypothetical protein [Gammaproteobacteria bacterium]